MTDLKTEKYGTYFFKGIPKQLMKLAWLLPNNWLGVRLALILRKLSLQNRIHLVDAHPLGFKARLYPLDNLGDRLVLFLPWYFEWEEFALMDQYLKPDSIFLDIGGNSGFYSLWASRLVEKGRGRIVTFEPNPVMFERLLFNARQNELEDFIEAQPIGLADKDTSFYLSLNPTNLGGASLINEYGQGGVEVQCRPLLDVAKDLEIERIDFIKIDIEGAEPLVLNPFFENAPKQMFPKFVLIESAGEITFERYGYKIIRRTKNNTLFGLSSR